MKTLNNETMLRKPPKNRWLKVTAGAAVAVGAAIGIGIAADQWGDDSNSGTTLQLQNTLSALRSFESADYLHLSIKLSGSLVSGNRSQLIDIYVNDLSSSSNGGGLVNFDDIVSDEILSNLNAFVTFAGAYDNAHYNVSLVNEQGFYTILNTTSGEVETASCVPQSYIPPLESIVQSMFDSTEVDSDATYAGPVEDLLQCADGMMLEQSWDSKDFVLCIKYDEKTGEQQVISAATENIEISIEYLGMKDITDESIVNGLSAITENPNFKHVNSTTDCPILDFSQQTSDLRSSMALAGVPSRFLSESKPAKRKWYESKWGRAQSDAPVGKRHLFTSYDFTVTTTESEFDNLMNFAEDVLGCVYFCAPSEFGSEEIPLNEINNHVTFSDNTFRKLSEESYDYLGCFKDTSLDRILSKKIVVRTRNGPKKCAELCQGYDYFGLQNLIRCWCGNSDEYAKHGAVAESKCDESCRDQTGAKCGGNNKMSMYQYGSSDAVTSSHHITLPRPCVLVHGPGMGWASDRNERRAEAITAGSRSGLYLDPSLQKYFGCVEETLPCYCSSMKFVRANTMQKEWYDASLETTVCRSIAIESNPISEVTAFRFSQNSLPIKNTVVITHYTASLTLAAALARGFCSFDSSSKWATIHTPVGQSFVDAIEEGELAGNSLLLCTESNIEEYAAEVGKYTFDELAVTSTFESVLATVLSSGGTVKNVFQSCSASGHDLNSINVKIFANHSFADRYPEDMQVLYVQAQAQMVEHVSAALCGHGTHGVLSAKSLINDYAATLVTPTEESDGVTPLENCLKLADLQGDGVEFGTDSSYPYYVTGSHFSDVHEFRDSWVGDAAEMREWVDKLRLHEDL